MTPIERLAAMSIPEPMSGCWLWLGALRQTHPGKTYRSALRTAFRLNGRVIDAARAAWLLHRGDVPSGLSVCHHCDNSLCVNPDHLYVATHQKNMDDARKRGRLIGTGKKQGQNCPQGHLFTPQNTRWRISHGRPLAVCRTCERFAYEAYTKTDAYRAKLARQIEKRRLTIRSA